MPISAVPPWLATMRDITGTLETSGDANNPVILAWRDEIASRFPEMAAYCKGYTHDAIPWCGLTVAYCMAHNGIRPMFGAGELERFLWAQSWKQFGSNIDQPQFGDVLVFARHVTLYEGEDGDHYICRGGNQSDSVNVSHYRKDACEAIRRPPAAAATIPLIVTPPVAISSAVRCTAITATEFGGRADPNTSYYDGHVISDFELGVALPAPFTGTRRKVRVFKGSKSVDCDIVDLGPWNTNDPYWDTGTRPQAESGTDRRGRDTNLAGIDLTPAAARAIGLDGKSLVDWEFVGAPVTKPGGTTMPTPVNNIVTLLQQALSVLQSTQTQTSQQPPTGQTQPQPEEQVRKVLEIINAVLNAGKDQPLGSVNGALGQTIGDLLNGKKTAIGIFGSLATALLSQAPTTVTTALGSLIGLGSSTAAAPVALPIFLAIAAWGVLGKFEKWSQGGTPPTQ